MRHHMWGRRDKETACRHTEALKEDASATLDLNAMFCCLVANEVCKKAAILAISSAATN
jgi:hypothetical protein